MASNAYGAHFGAYRKVDGLRITLYIDDLVPYYHSDSATGDVVSFS